MYPELVFKKKGNCHSQFVLRRSSWKSGHKADREEILKILCGGGGEVKFAFGYRSVSKL